MTSPTSRMKNYRDLSVNGGLSPGFQYEFFCQGCDKTWTSPFKPHRMGQLSGWLSSFVFMFGNLRNAGRATGTFASASSRQAAGEALAAAQEQARRLFTACQQCKKQYCDDCLDGHGVCKSCQAKAADEARQASRNSPSGGDGQMRCPNCQCPSSGGRFCPECGFDMASTHKGCPACGSVMPRAARFCTDCGHGF